MLILTSNVVDASSCVESHGEPDAVRVLPVDPGATPRVGRKHFPTTLPLAPREVVLTFDDGPWPGTTSRVLDALKAECVRATFFFLGRNAATYPTLARRVLAEGHTVGSHTYSHPLLGHMAPSKAMAEIERGNAAVDRALVADAAAKSRAPFFRFPGFASSPALLDLLERRGIAVFGTDVWASDWVPMTPSAQLALVMARIKAANGGIVLLHDTKAQTAAMLPALLAELRNGGFRFVHVVPAGATNVSSR